MYCKQCSMEKETPVTCDDVGCSLMSEFSNNDFDIESLDPDERSWYYDGAGVKRKKPSNE